jgi:hypothetical protein
LRSPDPTLCGPNEWKMLLHAEAFPSSVGLCPHECLVDHGLTKDVRENQYTSRR